MQNSVQYVQKLDGANMYSYRFQSSDALNNEVECGEVCIGSRGIFEIIRKHGQWKRVRLLVF